MVSLLDIAELKETVQIRNKDIDVNGITSEHIVSLFHSYPELRKLASGFSDKDAIQSLINQAPIAVAHIIALGTTGADAAEADIKKMAAAARKLTVGEQYAILEKIGKLTFPQGPMSFLERVGGALGLPPGDLLGKVQAMKSPASSSAALPPGETNEPAGNQHPEPSSAG